MDQLIEPLIPIGVLIFGLLIGMRRIVPRPTRMAIQRAIWQRIICGSSSNAISVIQLAKYLLIGIGLLILLSRC